MIIRGTPDDIDKFFATDGETAFLLQQKGLCPLYIDSDFVYFKKTNKLLKTLSKIETENRIERR